MFILKLAGKIALLPVWVILTVLGITVKILVQMYSIVRGIFGLLLVGLILGTAICYHDWVQVVALAIASAILYLVLFAGVFVDTLLDVTRENIVDFILS